VGQSFRSNPANEPTMRVPTGDYDPLLGRTYFEIAAEGRSQHKTQEMGQVERHGPFFSGERLADSVVAKAGDAATEKSVFDGIDTSTVGIAKLAGLPEGALRTQLTSMQQAAQTAVKELDVLAPAKIIPTLAGGLRATREARAALKSMTGAAASKQAIADADFLLSVKEDEFEDALVRASGLVVDALADQEIAAPGESVRATVNVYQTTPVKIASSRAWVVLPAPSPPSKAISSPRWTVAGRAFPLG